MKLFKRRRLENGYLLLLTAISVFLLVGYFSYAMFTVKSEQKEAIRIITGTLEGELKVDGNLTDQLVVSQGETKEFTVTLKNINDRTTRYLLYYIGTLPEGLEVGYTSDGSVPPEENGKNITSGTTETYIIKVKNTTTSSQTIQLQLDSGLEHIDLALPENGHLFEEMRAVPAVELLLTDYTNEESAEFDIEKADNSVNHKMFVFHHEAGAQQEGWSEEELTDYRYIGADPNNYVTFNGEEAGWRIIGIFTVENENGEKEQRIKLIRSSAIDTLSWDNKNSGEGTAEDTNGYGSNNWSDSRLMMLLNEGYQDDPLAIGGSLYWNRGSGLCPNGSKGATKNCNFTNTGLTQEAQGMIGNTKWYLGGTANYKSASDGLASHFYGYERGTETCQTTGKCTTKRETSWIGKVGLMYPSDYGYATSGGSTTNREACLAKEMYNWDVQAVSDCKNNDWLLSSSTQWTMSPSSDYSDNAFDVTNTGFVSNNNNVSLKLAVRPVLYLVSDILCSGGTGSKDEPFVFTK